jgi:GNAT superfamily N-acetyltransferase
VRLAEDDRGRFTEHLLSLAPGDRQLRFGHGAADDAINHYANTIDFAVDAVFVIYGTGAVPTASAHLSHGIGYAELGLSVLEGHRGQGLGSALFEQSLRTCTHWSISQLFTHCFVNNRPMVRLARKYGMKVIVNGAEADGAVPVPAILPPNSPVALPHSKATPR